MTDTARAGVAARPRPSTHRITLAAAALLVAAANPAAAQDGDETEEAAGDAAGVDTGGGAEIEPVVVSTTRTETPVSELTRSVTRIDREELAQESRVQRNIGEILGKKVPGMGTGTGALTNFTQNLRGRDFLTLIDGIPQNTPLRSVSRHLNTISQESVERVEVVRGGTAAYGFGATGGQVNLITRRPEKGTFNAASKAGVSLSTEHPDDSVQYNTRHRISGRTGQVDYLLSGTFARRNSLFDSDGDRIPPDPLRNQGGLSETDEFNIFGKGGYTFGGGEQRVEVMASRFDIEQDTDFRLQPGNASAGQKATAQPGDINVRNPLTEVTSLAATYEHEDLMGSSVEVKSYYNDSTARFSKIPTSLFGINFPQSEVRSEKIGVRSTVETPLPVGGTQVTAIYGLDFLHDETVQDRFNARRNVPKMDQNAYAAFAELEVPVGTWGQIRAGLRQEHIAVDVDSVTNSSGQFVQGGTLTFDETLVNASGVVFLSDRAEVFGGFSQGFTVGDIGRAIRDGGNTITRADQLEDDAQKVNNYELGVRGRTHMASASLVGFYSTSENGTTFNTGNLNLTKRPERIWGAEATVSVDPSREWSFGGTFSWQDGVVDLDDDGSFEEDLPSTRIPPLKLTAHAEYSPVPWWTTRVQGLHSGSRSPDSTQFGGNPVDQFTVFDVVSSVNTRYGQLDLGIDNVLNNDYFPVSSQAWGSNAVFTQAPGRRVSLTYSVKW